MAGNPLCEEFWKRSRKFTGHDIGSRHFSRLLQLNCSIPESRLLQSLGANITVQAELNDHQLTVADNPTRFRLWQHNLKKYQRLAFKSLSIMYVSMATTHLNLVQYPSVYDSALFSWTKDSSWNTSWASWSQKSDTTIRPVAPATWTHRSINQSINRSM